MTSQPVWNLPKSLQKEVVKGVKSLTPRETEVLSHMIGGAKNTSIAAKLKISRKTLDIHRSKIYKKTQARTLADLVHCAYAQD